MNPQALILIDVQQGFDNPGWGKRNNPDAEQNIARLLAFWRQRSWPVVHVRHCSLSPGSPLQEGQPGNAYKPESQPLPGEPDFKKSVNSAFIGTDLESYLRDQAAQELVMAGLTTDHCVSTSVRMAANMGFDVTMVSDATATFDRTGPDGTYYSADLMHAVNLASLNGEFCRVVSTSDLLEAVK
jgi:nicotinamidase-related amidase